MASNITVSPSGWNYNPFKKGNRNGAGKELKKRAVWWEQGADNPKRTTTPHSKLARFGGYQ